MTASFHCLRASVNLRRPRSIPVRVSGLNYSVGILFIPMSRPKFHYYYGKFTLRASMNLRGPRLQGCVESSRVFRVEY